MNHVWIIGVVVAALLVMVAGFGGTWVLTRSIGRLVTKLARTGF